MNPIAEIFGPEGPLANTLKNFTARTEQREMAEMVASAIEKRDTLIVEAGTGTGKTFAYLAPSLVSGKKILISTGTKTLQDQLYKKDLPTLCAALGLDPKLSLLKGRQNYLCRHRMDLTLAQGRLPAREQVSQLHRIKDWSHHTDDGDIGEMNDIPEGSPIWQKVTSTSDNCLGADCPQSDQCFVNDVRAKAHKADIVVCNHHLFFSDMALIREGISDLLPTVDAYIFDEAHQLADIAHQFLGQSFSSGQIKNIISDTTTALESEAEDMKTEFAEFHQELNADLNELQNCFARLPSRGTWIEFANSPDVAQQITNLVNRLSVYCGHLEEIAIRGNELNRVFERCENLCVALDEMTQINPGFIQWYEVRKQSIAFHNTPLEVATSFNERIVNSNQAWIFTSATISINNEFGYFRHRLGIKEAICESWPSPFDYKNNSLLYLPTTIKEPSHPQFTQSIVENVLPVLKLSKGKAFLLFTSLSALDAAALLLRDSPYELFIQGTMSKTRLLDGFKKSSNGVLLGSASFWEGVDVKGDALSLVVIDKLPFASPGDPVIKAKISNIREKGGEPFWQYQLPHAVISLKQGVGRLIRDENDKGVLMICDPRIRTKGYGRIFLNSLPEIPTTNSITDVEMFFSASFKEHSNAESTVH